MAGSLGQQKSTPDTPALEPDSNASASQTDEDAATDSQAQTVSTEHAEQLQQLIVASAQDLPQHVGEWLAQSISQTHEQGRHTLVIAILQAVKERWDD